MVDVVHFTDAGCPWCYSAEPVRIALEERYGGQLRWRHVQVGLHESAATMEEKGYTTAGVAEGYRKIHERHGMPFCAKARPRLMGTSPRRPARLRSPAIVPRLGAPTRSRWPWGRSRRAGSDTRRPATSSRPAAGP